MWKQNGKKPSVGENLCPNLKNCWDFELFCLFFAKIVCIERRFRCKIYWYNKSRTTWSCLWNLVENMSPISYFVASHLLRNPKFCGGNDNSVHPQPPCLATPTPATPPCCSWPSGWSWRWPCSSCAQTLRGGWVGCHSWFAHVWRHEGTLCCLFGRHVLIKLCLLRPG